MLTWGRLSDVVENGKGLDLGSTLFFVFSNEYVQLFAIELNTGAPNISDRGQLFLHGIDAEGVNLIALGGDYSPVTVGMKQADGLPFDRVTLYQEGDFYRSWQFVQQKDGFVLRADTIKEGEDLRARWGENLVGLTDESVAKLNIEVLPLLIEQILSEILH